MRIVAAALLTVLLSSLPASSRAPEPPAYKKVEKLYTGNTTVTGETISYPSGNPARIQSLIVTMQPGETTGWHKHAVPTYGYILSGNLTVDYGEKGKRVYRAGEGFMEAMDWWHNGANSGSAPARVLVVFMGAAGHKAVVREGAPGEAYK